MLTYLSLFSSEPMALEKSYAPWQTLLFPSSERSPHRLLEIQSKIAVAKDNSEQGELITSAVRLLYPFQPLEKQVDYCDSPTSCSGGRTSQLDPEVFSRQYWSEAHLRQREEHQQGYVT